jgi:hypothetical protein
MSAGTGSNIVNASITCQHHGDPKPLACGRLLPLLMHCPAPAVLTISCGTGLLRSTAITCSYAAALTCLQRLPKLP